MSRHLRPRQPGASIFFTVALADRGSDLLVQGIESLRAAARSTRFERPFRIDAWVVLPDHLHCIWTLPDNDADHSTRWGAIKARFSMNLRRAGFTPPTRGPGGVNPALRKGEAGIWQRRFWEHHIRDEADWQAHLRYCWINPVKHGLVSEPEDWPYSSWHRDVGGMRGQGGPLAEEPVS